MEIYSCLKKETRAQEIFKESNLKLATAVRTNDGNLAVNGLIEMVFYMVDMGLEQSISKKKTGKKLCEHFSNVIDQRPDKDLKHKKFQEGVKVWKEMQNKDTRF